MEVLNTVDLVGGVYSKGYSIQGLAAHHTGKAVRVVRLTSGPQQLRNSKQVLTVAYNKQ
jgi:hypothetical protein